MSFLGGLDPLELCCPHCLEKLRDGQGIGVQFECGHIDCCTSKKIDNRLCLRPGCESKEQPVFLDYKSEHAETADEEIEAYGKSASILCVRCLRRSIDPLVNLRSASILTPSIVCGSCLREGEALLWYDLDALCEYFGKFLDNFPPSYTDFSQQLAQRGIDLSFRDQLDRRVADIMDDFRLKKVVELFRTGHRSNLVIRWASRFFRTVLDRRLGDLGRVFRWLADSLNAHSQGSLLAELTRAVFGETPEEAHLALVPKSGQSLTTTGLEALMAKDWPFGLRPLRTENIVWDKLRHCRPFRRKNTRKSARNVLSLVFCKEMARRRSLFRGSVVVSPADFEFLLGWLPGIVETNCLAQISEELNSGYKFHEAVKDKPNTLLLLHSQGRRLGTS